MLRAAVLAGAVLAAVAATPAPAAVTAPNACRYSINDEFRPQAVGLGGHGSPLGATPGSQVTLSGAWLAATLPPSLPQAGYDLGLFRKGRNAIPSRVWLALRATNTTAPDRVVALAVDASTTIAVNADGSFRSGTPIEVVIPIPDQTWTVAGEGPVTFSQAPAGTLPALPVGVAGRPTAVTGSIVVAPRLGTLRYVLDCQPGTTAPPYAGATPAEAVPFATLDAAAPVPAVLPGGRAALAATAVSVVDGRLRVPLTCRRAASPCTGRVAVRTAQPITVTGRRARVTLAVATSYAIAPDAQRTVGLRLTARGREALRTRRAVPVRVTLAPSLGRAVVARATVRR